MYQNQKIYISNFICKIYATSRPLYYIEFQSDIHSYMDMKFDLSISTLGFHFYATVEWIEREYINTYIYIKYKNIVTKVRMFFLFSSKIENAFKRSW